MNKKEFLKELEVLLSKRISKTETKRILDYYDGYFDEANEFGKTDQEIINELGDIKELSKSIIEGLGGFVEDQEQQPKKNNDFSFEYSSDDDEKFSFEFNNSKSNKLLITLLAIGGVLLALTILVFVFFILGLVSVLIIKPIGLLILGVLFIVLICMLIALPFKLLRKIKRKFKKDDNHSFIYVNNHSQNERGTTMKNYDIYNGNQEIEEIEIDSKHIDIDIEFTDEDLVEVKLMNDDGAFAYDCKVENGSILFKEKDGHNKIHNTMTSPKLRISLPEENTDLNINVSVTNGKIRIFGEDVELEGDCKLQSVNGKILVEHITCKQLTTETVNGKIEIDECFFERGRFDTVNGKIYCDLSDDIVANKEISVTTVNGSAYIDGDKMKKGFAGATSIKQSYTLEGATQTTYIQASTINGSVELNGIK